MPRDLLLHQRTAICMGQKDMQAQSSTLNLLVATGGYLVLIDGLFFDRKITKIANAGARFFAAGMF